MGAAAALERHLLFEWNFCRGVVMVCRRFWDRMREGLVMVVMGRSVSISRAESRISATGKVDRV